MNFRRVDGKNMYVARLGLVNVMKSYDTIIVIITKEGTFINQDYHDISKTTSRHKNLYLGVDSKEFQKRCKNGVYHLLPHNEIMEMYYSYIS